jgi:diaminohydroxyphosphoribosylaminopyrimidine deaminase/5-amino-6-(5-phosphoribosylamino)uracil reductase
MLGAMMTDDERFLRRAIRLAMNGRGRVEPNPIVGCVLVKDGRVIGEGYHGHFGGPHAEPTALASCTESPLGATAYVTLEPCCHTNKKTPPCAPRLIHEKIGRVVIGCLDPNPDVNGNGVRMLREAGIQVDGPVLEAECKQLIAPFLKWINESWTPYTTLKWAESADRCVAGAGGRRVQISNPTSSHLVQQLRSRSNGILVGINTVLNDDPTLLPRGLPVPERYRRFILDTHLRTPIDSQLVRTVSQSEVVVFSAWNAGTLHPERKRELVNRGVDVLDQVDEVKDDRYLVVEDWYHDSALWRRDSHLLVEPGPTLATTMLRYADRLWVIRSPNQIGDPTAPTAATVPDHYVATGTIDLDGDRLTEYVNTQGNVYFATVPSADFVLAGSSRPATQ